MKARLLLLVMLTVTGLVTSCSDDDDPKINPLVGEWELNDISVSEPPSSYSNVDGAKYTSFYGESEYLIKFNSDFSFTLELDFSSGGDAELEGTWEMDGADLTLEYDEDFSDLLTDFKINGEITDKSLVLDAKTALFALSDEILNDPMVKDTVDTDEKYYQLFQSHAQQVDVTLSLDFEKKVK